MSFFGRTSICSTAWIRKNRFYLIADDFSDTKIFLKYSKKPFPGYIGCIMYSRTGHALIRWGARPWHQLHRARYTRKDPKKLWIIWKFSKLTVYASGLTLWPFYTRINKLETFCWQIWMYSRRKFVRVLSPGEPALFSTSSVAYCLCWLCTWIRLAFWICGWICTFTSFKQCNWVTNELVGLSQNYCPEPEWK